MTRFGFDLEGGSPPVTAPPETEGWGPAPASHRPRILASPPVDSRSFPWFPAPTSSSSLPHSRYLPHQFVLVCVTSPSYTSLRPIHVTSNPFRIPATLSAKPGADLFYSYSIPARTPSSTRPRPLLAIAGPSRFRSSHVPSQQLLELRQQDDEVVTRFPPRFPDLVPENPLPPRPSR